MPRAGPSLAGRRSPCQQGCISQGTRISLSHTVLCLSAQDLGLPTTGADAPDDPCSRCQKDGSITHRYLLSSGQRAGENVRVETLPRPYSTSPLLPRPSTNGEAAITDVARVSWCFIVDVSTPWFLLSERHAHNGRAWRLVEGEKAEAIGRQRGSSSVVERWEHKIEDVTVCRLHRSSISSQLVHSALA